MKRMNLIYLSIGVILLSSCVSLRNSPLTAKEAIDISTQKVKQLHYHLEDMSILYDKDNVFWNKYTNAVHLFYANPEAKQKFQNHDFYDVYFRPNEKNALDGDIWVFIDRKTGKIFMTMEGVHVKYY